MHQLGRRLESTPLIFIDLPFKFFVPVGFIVGWGHARRICPQGMKMQGVPNLTVHRLPLKSFHFGHLVRDLSWAPPPSQDDLLACVASGPALSLFRYVRSFDHWVTLVLSLVPRLAPFSVRRKLSFFCATERVAGLGMRLPGAIEMACVSMYSHSYSNK